MAISLLQSLDFFLQPIPDHAIQAHIAGKSYKTERPSVTSGGRANNTRSSSISITRTVTRTRQLVPSGGMYIVKQPTFRQHFYSLTFSRQFVQRQFWKLATRRKESGLLFAQESFDTIIHVIKNNWWSDQDILGESFTSKVHVLLLAGLFGSHKSMQGLSL